MAAEIQVRFMHPIDGRILTVTLDTTYTAKEVIDELISNNFIQRDPAGYDLAIKGGTGLQQNQTLADAALRMVIRYGLFPPPMLAVVLGNQFPAWLGRYVQHTKNVEVDFCFEILKRYHDNATRNA